MAIQPKDMQQVDNTVIGESILVNGKLEGDEDLTVRGRVQGSITLTKTLIIEPSGVVKADATVRNAIVSGVVVGNITASESVQLTREGRMVGDINSPRVIIVEGAAFRGRIDMGDVAEPRLEERRSQTAPVPAARPAMPARPVTPPAPPRPTAVAKPPPPPPRPVMRPIEPAAKPPPPPPPPAMKPSVASGGEASAPMPVGIGKRKVVVKRKK